MVGKDLGGLANEWLHTFLPLDADAGDVGANSTHDSGFCEMAGILALHNIGVFGQALIKNRDGIGRLVFGVIILMLTLQKC